MIRTLTHADFPLLHRAFVEAFSDYAVPFAPAEEQLAEMFTRRGAVMDASPAAFEDDRIVAFTINGIEGSRAYDTGTGVIPSHRRNGLARTLMQHSFDALRARGCSEYVLEVLEQNEKAIALYRDLGFVETRRLQCWTFELAADDAQEPFASDAEIHEEWWTSSPSWQNSTASIRRARHPHRILGDRDAYIVVFLPNGDVPQFAVRPEARREKRGTRLLASAARIANKPLRILNADDRDDGLARFLERAGARKIICQIEMLKLL